MQIPFLHYNHYFLIKIFENLEPLGTHDFSTENIFELKI